MKALPPNINRLIADAENRDRRALQRLYAMLGAWLKAGKAPPEPLASWAADRLGALARSLDPNGDRKNVEADAARALLIRSASKGRAPKQSTARRNAAYVGDVLHFMEWHRLEAYPAIEAAAAYHKSWTGIDCADAIRKAWENRQD